MKIKKWKSSLLVLLIGAFCLGCKTKPKSQGEWMYLLEGENVKAWRAYNGETLPDKWIIEAGELRFDTEKRLEEDRKGGSDIIYGGEMFENFELALEWKLPPGGNSGIFYHLKEGYSTPSEVAPEYQLLDDLQWEAINNATLEEWQKTAADYAMYTPDNAVKIVKAAGAWNSSKIIFTPEKVEHWLNGQMVLSFVPWSVDWEERKNKGKWKNTPNYGLYRTGYIGLQDHDSPLWFRNIKIRKL